MLARATSSTLRLNLRVSGALHAGIDLAAVRRVIVGDDQVVAVDAEQGGDRHLHIAAVAQLAYAQFALGERLHSSSLSTSVLQLSNETMVLPLSSSAPRRFSVSSLFEP